MAYFLLSQNHIQLYSAEISSCTSGVAAKLKRVIGGGKINREGSNG